MFLDPVLLQIGISAVPLILFFATFPAYSATLGLTSEQLGLFFLLVRLGSLAGTQSGPFLLRHLSEKFICVLSELLNAVITAILYFSILHGQGKLVIALALFKAFPIGVIPNVRVHWLKSGYSPSLAQNILLAGQVLLQVAYGLGGLLVILLNDSALMMNIVAVDAVTSVVGAILFIFAKEPSIKIKPKKMNLSLGKKLLEKTRIVLFATEILATFSLGGTNIFLVQFGQSLKFSEKSGYGLSLILYAAAFGVAGIILQRCFELSKLKVKYIGYLGAAIALSLILLKSELNLAKMSGASMAFVAYSALLLVQNAIWFQLLEPLEIAPIFALRAILVGVLSSVLERLYAGVGLYESIDYRIASAIGIAFLAAVVLMPSSKEVERVVL